MRETQSEISERVKKFVGVSRAVFTGAGEIYKIWGTMPFYKMKEITLIILFRSPEIYRREIDT